MSTENTSKEIITDLLWRSATKKFDPAGELSMDEKATILEAIRLAPTSYGLQAFKVKYVVDAEVRKQLRPVSWGQSQIVDATMLLVFCAKVAVGKEEVSAYLDRRAAALDSPRAQMSGAEDFMVGKISEIPSDVQPHWTAKQAYIALGMAMDACARLRVDSCPIEGIEPSEYDRILGLKEEGYTASVVLAIGRAAGDAPNHPKFRKPMEDLVETV